MLDVSIIIKIRIIIQNMLLNGLIMDFKLMILLCLNKEFCKHILNIIILQVF